MGGFTFLVFLNPWASILKFWIFICSLFIQVPNKGVSQGWTNKQNKVLNIDRHLEVNLCIKLSLVSSPIEIPSKDHFYGIGNRPGCLPFLRSKLFDLNFSLFTEKKLKAVVWINCNLSRELKSKTYQMALDECNNLKNIIWIFQIPFLIQLKI